MGLFGGDSDSTSISKELGLGNQSQEGDVQSLTTQGGKIFDDDINTSGGSANSLERVSLKNESSLVIQNLASDFGAISGALDLSENAIDFAQGNVTEVLDYADGLTSDAFDNVRSISNDAFNTVEKNSGTALALASESLDYMADQNEHSISEISSLSSKFGDLAENALDIAENSIDKAVNSINTSTANAGNLLNKVRDSITTESARTTDKLIKAGGIAGVGLAAIFIFTKLVNL